MAFESSQRASSSSTPRRQWIFDVLSQSSQRVSLSSTLQPRGIFDVSSKSSQRASSTSTPQPQRTYDVFLSFCGDTRKNFTDHLHAFLKRKGTIVFRDDKKLKRGEGIAEELFKAIDESEYAIIVISNEFAFSGWCLLELVRILERQRKKRLRVLPIFYDVDPSHVRKTKGPIAEAFKKHRNAGIDKVQRNEWKEALKSVGELGGWDVRNRHESEVLEEIYTVIRDGLAVNLPNISQNLFGIESQMEEIMDLLCIGPEDVHIVGIYGMSGIGKTTLAEVVYHSVSSRFDEKCFIANVREESKNLVHLQQKLLSQILKETREISNTREGVMEIASKLQSKKVFIVLDNVDKEEQLEMLVGCHDRFGKGSRILITSIDGRLMKKYAGKTYKVEKLRDDDALHLFSINAFKSLYPDSDYLMISKEIVNYADCHPLALKVFGCLLYDSSMYAWTSALSYLKAKPNVTIMNKLQISFDSLEASQKELFLDIACFFK